MGEDEIKDMSFREEHEEENVEDEEQANVPGKQPCRREEQVHPKTALRVRFQDHRKFHTGTLKDPTS